MGANLTFAFLLNTFAKAKPNNPASIKMLSEGNENSLLKTKGYKRSNNTIAITT